ncbi:MAG: CPBP family intramembrane metalloprotease [Clostridiales bacterium]|nr:CPBP family intramembrane metalloprotease [Clostridiales bacterium]
MKTLKPAFLNTMSFPQKVWGLIFLPLHIFILPLFIAMLGFYMPELLTDVSANLVYYGFSLAFCLICMWSYLRRGFDFLIDNFRLNTVSVFYSYIVYMLFALLVSAFLLWILGDNFSNPNNEAVELTAGKSYGVMVGLAVFIAPMVEEILFRGVLFGSLLKKNRAAAYIISIALFGFSHLWQYSLVEMDPKLLIYVIQYIPAGYVLARLYEKTSCIWLPIFFHMGINMAAMLTIS